MVNYWDNGIKEDFDNMTKELGRSCTVYTRDNVLTYESQEGDTSSLDTGVTEIVFLQELGTTHEMVASGQMNVGDVKFTFLSDSIAEPEAYVSPDNGTTMYKILTLNIIRNQYSNTIMEITGFGKKIPNR